jgi:demethylmenaquinone methyltransferase/2-methoxy-6-polyprenyl-1,4-benzoquinol methylase
MKFTRPDDASTPRDSGHGTTHFGYEQVAEEEKACKVAGVFESVAGRYDLMNDLMSAGLHRWWKRYAVEQSRVRRGERVLDVAGGTGDLTRLFSERVGADGTVVLTDISGAMLTRGRDRLLDVG